MDKIFCPMQKWDMFNECVVEKCAWFDREAGKCAVAVIPDALDILTRFILTESYPSSSPGSAPWFEDD